MNDQLALEFRPLTKNEQRAAAFHAANPQVFELLERFAANKISEGATRIGIGHLCERLRYDTSIPTVDAHSTFKINNTYRAYFADLLIAKHPEWDRIIQRRVRKSA